MPVRVEYISGVRERSEADHVNVTCHDGCGTITAGMIGRGIGSVEEAEGKAEAHIGQPGKEEHQVVVQLARNG